MAGENSSINIIKEWVSEHKLRSVGIIWASGLAASLGYNWSRPHMKTSVKIMHARKKVQHKKVVCVPIAGDPSKDKGQTPPTDFWAWRKYGQKPIKGSPYPRGYYRCSSSKGCSARKQVERSRRDPSMLIVTYTAEHNHAMGNLNKLSTSSSKDHDKEGFNEDLIENDDDDEMSNLSNLNQGHNYRLHNNKGSLIHGNEKYSNTSHFSSILDSPSSCEYAFEEEKQLLDPSPWMCLEEGGHFQYVDWQEEDAKEEVCLSSRSEGDDFFSELGMLPELASIFNKRDIDNIEERTGPDEIRSITLDPQEVFDEFPL